MKLFRTTSGWRPASLLISLLALYLGNAQAQTIAINFDNSGAEAGVTPLNTRDFSFMGARWSGGTVQQPSDQKFQASGLASYRLGSDGSIVFDRPVQQVRMFFVHGDDIQAGTAELFAADGSSLTTINSRIATTNGDTDNFVDFSSLDRPITSVRFNEGVVDNFAYTLVAADDFAIDAKIEGAWFFPSTSGSGLLFDYLPGDPAQLFVAWFTYDTAGASFSGSAQVGNVNQRWFTAIGELSSLNSVNLTLFNSEDGVFDTSTTVNTTATGSMIITFSNCREALVTYQIDGTGLSGQFPIEPVDPSLATCDEPPT